MNYLSGDLKIIPAKTGDPLSDAPFLKYLYLNYGFSLDYQNTKDRDRYSGFGLGVGAGIGARYDYKSFFFCLNPKFERHLFMSESYGLMEFGVMMGIGYSF